MKSILNYPYRGNGGSAAYRGNCAPQLIEDLIQWYHWTEISDYMCGSGTTRDVANKLNIISHCYDLNEGFDLLGQDIQERNSAIFWHPPYWNMIQYSDFMYSSKDIIDRYGVDPRSCDLSRCKTWEEFVKKMNYCCMKQYTSLEKGGRMAILLGDIRKRGRLYSMLVDLVKPGTIENLLIKVQNNCTSDAFNYSFGHFIRISHEYVLILRKDSALIYPVKWMIPTNADIRDMKAAAWKDIVASVFNEYGSVLRLDEIYRALQGKDCTKNRKYWKEKVRQTLQVYPFFSSDQRGVWCYRKL